MSTLGHTQRENYKLLNLNSQLRAVLKKPKVVINKFDSFNEFSDDDDNEVGDSISQTIDLDEILEELRAENEKLHFENLNLEQKLGNTQDEF